MFLRTDHWQVSWSLGRWYSDRPSHQVSKFVSSLLNGSRTRPGLSLRRSLCARQAPFLLKVANFFRSLIKAPLARSSEVGLCTWEHVLLPCPANLWLIGWQRLIWAELGAWRSAILLSFASGLESAVSLGSWLFGSLGELQTDCVTEHWSGENRYFVGRKHSKPVWCCFASCRLERWRLALRLTPPFLIPEWFKGFWGFGGISQLKSFFKIFFTYFLSTIIA